MLVVVVVCVERAGQLADTQSHHGSRLYMSYMRGYEYWSYRYEDACSHTDAQGLGFVRILPMLLAHGRALLTWASLVVVEWRWCMSARIAVSAIPFLGTCR